MTTSTANPLSFAQQGLWLAHQLRPDDSSYHIVKAYRLTGELDVSAFRLALDGLMARHDVLRGTYTLVDDQPVHCAGPPVPMPCELMSVRGDGRDELAEFASRPFDLATGRVIRAALSRVGEQEWIFALCLHHVAGDAASVGVLCRELTMLYTAHRAGRAPDLPPAPQFHELARRQRALLRGEHLVRLAEFWRRELADLPDPLFAGPPVPAAGRPVRMASVTLTGGEVTELAAKAHQHSVTVHMVLLGAFARAIADVCRRDDILIGMPVAQRLTATEEQVVGCLVDMLLVRLRPRGNDWPRLLAQVLDRCLDTYEHHLPVEALLEEVRSADWPHMSVPFEAVFGFQHQPSDRFQLPGLTVVPESPELPSVQVPLDLEGLLDSDRLTLTLRYDVSQVGAPVAEDLLGHMVALLAARDGRHG